MYLNIKKVDNFSEIDYQLFSEPILVSNGCSDMTAIQKWNRQYLTSIFKKTPIDIEVYSNKQSMGQTKVKKYIQKPFESVMSHMLKNIPPYYYFSEISLKKYKNKINNNIFKDIQYKFDNLRKAEDELIFLGYESQSGCHLHVTDDYI